jgi:hypothetical protein
MEGARRLRMGGHVGSKLPTETTIGWVEGASAASVKAVRPLRGGPVGRP